MGVIFSIFPMRKGGQGGKGEGNFGRSNLPLNHCAILPSLKLPPSDPRFPRFLPKASYPILYSPGGGLVLGSGGAPWVLRKNNGVGGRRPILPAQPLTAVATLPFPVDPGALDQDGWQRLGQVPGDVGVQ